MRDLTRPNALRPAYIALGELGYQVFTPLRETVSQTGGSRRKVMVPFIHDLLFVRARRSRLDETVRTTPTLQYRFVKGMPYGTPMTVGTDDMERFIAAVSGGKPTRYYSPGEITPDMYGRRVRMICSGPLNGYEGRLMRMRGSGKKRLIVALPGLLAASVEIDKADFIEIL